SRVLDIWTSAASKPMRNCSRSKSGSRTDSAPPERAIHPASTASQAAKQKVKTGLLPNLSKREPRNHRLLNPPRNATDVTSSILSSAMPASVLRNATEKAVRPPYDTDQPTTQRSNHLKGAYPTISSHGTAPFAARTSSGISASGMRLRKLRLIAPVTALKANKIANCQGCGSPARHAAATRKVTKLARF